ncbi:hypothetical protein Scep_022474 [Stephania cephalantha]|uniref:Uncharacterized protein n=1 Tax=Stephania cephalantha TaxID=152367 RepID=A0AAP0I2A1_9MAGN
MADHKAAGWSSGAARTTADRTTECGGAEKAAEAALGRQSWAVGEQQCEGGGRRRGGWQRRRSDQRLGGGARELRPGGSYGC